MALGDRWRSWFGGDDDDSAFSDDVWDTLGVDKSPDDDSWWDSVGTTINPIEESNWIDDWSNFDVDKEYGIGSLVNEAPNIFDDDWATTYDFGDRRGPTVDFEDPNFNWGEFDVDSYLDDLLDPNYGGGTEGDPSSWFIDSGDPSTGLPSIADFDTSILDEVESAGGLDTLLPVTERSLWEGIGDTGGIFSGKRMPKAANFFNKLFGGAKDVGSKLESGIGGLLDSNLGKLLLANYLTKKDEGPAGVVPVGADAFSAVGGDGGGGSPIDYRVMNLQPALMPGVAYANVGNDEPSIPPGMKGGGLGDITLARLEPGEFVVTKKAVDNIGAKNLYKMMKQAEGRG